MNEIIVIIIATLSKEFLLPLARALLEKIVELDDVGISNDCFDKITDVMSKSSHNTKGE